MARVTIFLPCCNGIKLSYNCTGLNKKYRAKNRVATVIVDIKSIFLSFEKLPVESYGTTKAVVQNFVLLLFPLCQIRSVRTVLLKIASQ